MATDEDSLMAHEISRSILTAALAVSIIASTAVLAAEEWNEEVWENQQDWEAPEEDKGDKQGKHPDKQRNRNDRDRRDAPDQLLPVPGGSAHERARDALEPDTTPAPWVDRGPESDVDGQIDAIGDLLNSRSAQDSNEADQPGTTAERDVPMTIEEKAAFQAAVLISLYGVTGVPVQSTSNPFSTNTPAYICGPDVTENVLAALREIRSAYNGWSAAKQEAKCDEIHGFVSGISAWDIYELSPERAPNKRSSEDVLKVSKYWFEKDAPGCCIPRWPCGPTVEFFGQCVHSQVVNYAQWGAMNKLCDTPIEGFLDLKLYTVLLPVVQIFPSLLQLETPDMNRHFAAQEAMSDLGGSYIDSLNAGTAQADFVEAWESTLSDATRIAAKDSGLVKKSNIKGLSDPGLFEDVKVFGGPESKCQLTCEVSLKRKRFKWKWDGE
jgi:hypothetical protein